MKFWNLLIGFLLLTNLISFIHPDTGSNSSTECRWSYDCVQGYCLDGKCVIPEVSDYKILGPCNTTADCVSGYCVDNTCILPLKGSSGSSFGFKSGCEGWLECSGGLCTVVCNLVWLILISVSLYSGYSTRSYENKVIPVVLTILPFLIGLLSYPIVGVLEGFVQLFYIGYRNVYLGSEVSGSDIEDTE